MNTIYQPLSSPLGEFNAQTAIGRHSVEPVVFFDPTQQTYQLTSAGQNIWGRQDDFLFLWRKLRGDFIATLSGHFPSRGVNAHRKFGWMARASLDPAAANAAAALHGDGLAILQFRPSSAAETGEVRSPLNAPDVIQLERRGSTFLASFARKGEPLQTVETNNLELGEELYLGIFACSHEELVAEQALLENVRIAVPAQPGFLRERDPWLSRMEILDLSNGRRTLLFESEDVFEAPNWTPDGKALIYNSGGLLWRYDLASGEHRRIHTGSVVHNNNDHVISFDGTQLAVSSHSGERGSQVYTLPIGGGEPALITPLGPSYLHGWSPDGEYLVYTALRNGDFDIYRIPSRGGEEVRLTYERGLDDGPEYSPDGAWIYFNSVRSGSMQLWRMRPAGTDPQQLTADEYNNWFPHVSPDGKRLLFVSYLPGEVEPSDHPPAKRVYLRSMPANGGKPRVEAYLYGGQGTMNVPSWSPDGNRAAFVSNSLPYR